MQCALFSSVWIFMIQHLTQNITKLVWLNCQNNSYYNSRVFEKALYHLVISHLWRRYKKSMIFVTTYFRGDLISKFPTNSPEIWPPLGKKLIFDLYNYHNDCQIIAQMNITSTQLILDCTEKRQLQIFQEI